MFKIRFNPDQTAIQIVTLADEKETMQAELPVDFLTSCGNEDLIPLLHEVGEEGLDCELVPTSLLDDNWAELEELRGQVRQLSSEALYWRGRAAQRRAP